MESSENTSTLLQLVHHPLIGDQFSAELKAKVEGLDGQEADEALLGQLAEELNVILPKLSGTRDELLAKLTQEMKSLMEQTHQHGDKVAALETRKASIDQGLQENDDDMADLEALAQKLKD